MTIYVAKHAITIGRAKGGRISIAPGEKFDFTAAEAKALGEAVKLYKTDDTPVVEVPTSDEDDGPEDPREL